MRGPDTGMGGQSLFTEIIKNWWESFPPRSRSRGNIAEIRNSAASAADDQTDEQGDFQINDCVFHVTVSPNRGHYDKCQHNLTNGLRVFLLVPDEMLAGARQNADLETNGRVSVESIESFVSQNIEELSDFAGDKVSQNIKLLLEKYNERVAEVETDLSLHIRIPAALER